MSRLLSPQTVVAQVKFGEADVAIHQAGQGFSRSCGSGGKRKRTARVRLWSSNRRRENSR